LKVVYKYISTYFTCFAWIWDTKHQNYNDWTTEIINWITIYIKIGIINIHVYNI